MPHAICRSEAGAHIRRKAAAVGGDGWLRLSERASASSGAVAQAAAGVYDRVVWLPCEVRGPRER